MLKVATNTVNALDPGDTLPRDALNALTANIAILDGRGVIVAVNDAWIRFARANGATDERCYVGADYLGVCESALARAPDAALAETSGLLRELLGGMRDELAVEYPCHSPSEERWFVLRATRLRGDPGRGAVVAHEDITLRKRAEMELRRAKDELEEVSRDLADALERERSLGRIDVVTGMINRRHFFELAEHELFVAGRYHDPLALMLFDIDHFKRANDTLGHQAGDDLLKRVARAGIEHLRASDIFARYGGDEFVILLPHTRAAEAAVVGERIRQSVAAAGGVTISIGVAELLSGEDSLDALIQRADEALYRAKHEGRNRLAVSSNDAHSPPSCL